ncbi:MAG: glycosyltransferase family 4 protein [Dehalococcoidales bacterium]|nr:glycosyltransferase family 4 protein [Dehalococcoidales bacterium]
MKVMFVIPRFYPVIGGSENYVYSISKLLLNYDIDISVICSNPSGKNYIEETIEGIRVYRLPYRFMISSTPMDPSWNKKINLIVQKEKPDIINGHLPVPYIADIAARVAFKNRIPFILTHHNDVAGHSFVTNILAKFYYYCLGFKTFKLSQKIIVTSEYYAESSPYLRNQRTKLEVVHCGIDVKRFDVIPTDHPRRDKTVLFVGQLNEASQHKGLAYLIEAMQVVTTAVKDARLRIVGKGDYVGHYKKLVSDLGMGDRVEFSGFVKDEDLPRCYNESDVVTLPSYTRAEGFGIVLIEAQGCGRPVIGSAIGGIPYAIEDGETGLLVPPKDTSALARAIIKLLEDKEYANKLGQNGYRRVREKFTWQGGAERTRQIFGECLSGQPKD